MQGRRGGGAEEKTWKKNRKYTTPKNPRHLTRTARMRVGVISYDTNTAAAPWILSCICTPTTMAAAR